MQSHEVWNAEVTAGRVPARQRHRRPAVGDADAFGVLLDAAGAYLGVRSGDDEGVSELTATRLWIGLHGQATLQANLPWHPWPDRNPLADDIITRLAERA